MGDRYWEADAPPDALLDWVNENVIAAIKDCWEDDKPVAWAEVEDGRMVLTVGGPPKPTADDPTGQINIYFLQFDLLEELKIYSDPYSSIGGPCSDDQREDMRRRAEALRKLSEGIAVLADRAAVQG